MKRYLAVFLTLWLAVFLGSCTHPNIAPDSKRYAQLVIVGTNDVHGYLRPKEEDFFGQKLIAGGAEWFGGYMRILEKKYGEHLIMLDAGDIFQGTLESNSFNGRPMIAYYNLLPYRAAAIGNHEFDYGPEPKNNKDRLSALKARIREAKFPFLSSNIIDRSTGKPWFTENFHPSTLFTVDGIKVGVIGLTTETTPQKTRPTNIVSLDFQSLHDSTLREATHLRAQGAEVILITAHEGGSLLDEPMPELLSSLPAGTVDAVVSGHTHTKINQFIAGIPVIQSVTRGLFFGRIDLFVDRQTHRVNPKLTKIHETVSICGTYFQNQDTCAAKGPREVVSKNSAELQKFLPLRPASYEGQVVHPDQAIHDVLEPYIAKVKTIRKRVVAHATRDFEHFASGESETGDLLTDALRKAYPKAKVAYYNGGGIRRMLQKGPITYGDMFEVMPFDNMVVLVEVTGLDLRHMLEIGTAGEQSVPALSGVRLEYFDSNDPKFERDLNGDGKKELWERNRLKSLNWDNGKPVLDQEKFWLITNDFLLDGGDRLGFVFSKIPRSRVQIQGIPLLDAVVNQLPKFKAQLPQKSSPRVLVAHE